MPLKRRATIGIRISMGIQRESPGAADDSARKAVGRSGSLRNKKCSID